MSKQLDSQALNQLFLAARTANGFLDQPVAPELLKQVYELARMAPTAMNSQPTRYVFITTPQAKARLLPLMAAGNVDKTRSAPVTVLVATDSKFYEHMPQIWHGAGAKEMIEGNPAMAGKMAGLNGVLGGAYFILAARAWGWTAVPWRGSMPPRSTPSSSPMAVAASISSSTWATPITARSSRATVA